MLPRLESWEAPVEALGYRVPEPDHSGSRVTWSRRSFGTMLPDFALRKHQTLDR